MTFRGLCGGLLVIAAPSRHTHSHARYFFVSCPAWSLPSLKDLEYVQTENNPLVSLPTQDVQDMIDV